MSLSRPDARITIDGTELGADEAALLRLTVASSNDGSHDHAAIALWPQSKFADAADGAVCTIALGERGDERQVFTGVVSARRTAPGRAVVEALAATIALSRSARSQSYVGQTIADIVRDLAGSAPVDEVDCGIKLNAYHVDNRRPVWSHLKALARLAGAELGCSADGGLRFVPAAGALTPLTLRFGAELLDWNLGLAAAPEASAVKAFGAASDQGDSRWHWIAHDPVGAGAATARVPAALATRDAAQAVSDAAAERAKRAAVRGELLIAGRPDLRPGGAVELLDVAGAPPGVLRVRSLVHVFDATGGFMTRLVVEGGSGGIGLGGLL